MGQIEAMANGTCPEQGILNASTIAARRGLELLKKRTNSPETPEYAKDDLLLESGMVGLEQDYSYDMVMGDGSPNLNFDVPDSWMFTGWDTNTEW